MKRTLIAALLILGIALVVTAIGASLAPDLLDQPGGLVALFAGVFISVSGLFGGKISEWADTVFGKKKEEQHPEVQQDIRNTIGGFVVGKVDTMNVLPPTEEEVHDTIGFIPPANAETYVHRGRIELDIRDALRAGGANAIVGLHAPGGTGKTELANRIAQEVRQGKLPFDDVLWVDVGKKSPEEVLGDMLRNCGIQVQPTAEVEEKTSNLRHYLMSSNFAKKMTRPSKATTKP